MAGKDDFKAFVRENPNLIKYVKDGSKTWQDFYEIFNLYGSSNSVWDTYLDKSVDSSSSFDLISWFKTIDLDSIQSGVESIQRVLSVVQDFTSGDGSSKQNDYNPRPLYKHFED